jgi:hypothetical protein
MKYFLSFLYYLYLKYTVLQISVKEGEVLGDEIGLHIVGVARLAAGRKLHAAVPNKHTVVSTQMMCAAHAL